MLVNIYVGIFHGRYYKLDGVKALNSASPVCITAGLASSPASRVARHEMCGTVLWRGLL